MRQKSSSAELWKEDTSAMSQMWTITHFSGNYYLIYNIDGRQYLTAPDNNKSDRVVKLENRLTTGSNRQLWKIERVFANDANKLRIISKNNIDAGYSNIVLACENFIFNANPDGMYAKQMNASSSDGNRSYWKIK